MADITIKLPDGSAREVPAGTTVGGLAAAIARGLAKKAVIGSVNGTERDLVWELADGDEVAFEATSASPSGANRSLPAGPGTSAPSAGVGATASAPVRP